MRHKYETRGIVLARAPVGEASAFLTILTPDLGLVRALAQSVRKPSAKLAAALATFAESEVVLLRGKESWRLAGAVLAEHWFARLPHAAARDRAARVIGLLLRLVAGETEEPALFAVVRSFFSALAELPEDAHEDCEILAALRLLVALGLDAGHIPGTPADFSPEALVTIMKDRPSYIARINRGIIASGL